jgi:succinate dehydrogenase flavin-adding protein (antitoxin of CptAB toxin-antitoxin module)
MTESEVKWRLRRSILELDVLMTSFYDALYTQLTLDEREDFIRLLLLEDPELFSCIFSKQKTSSTLLQKLRSHQV